MNHNCSTARYLGYFEHGMTRKAFRLATQPTGFLWVNATIWRLRQQGWIASSPSGWVLTRAGREVCRVLKIMIRLLCQYKRSNHEAFNLFQCGSFCTPCLGSA